MYFVISPMAFNYFHTKRLSSSVLFQFALIQDRGLITTAFTVAEPSTMTGSNRAILFMSSGGPSAHERRDGCRKTFYSNTFSGRRDSLRQHHVCGHLLAEDRKNRKPFTSPFSPRLFCLRLFRNTFRAVLYTRSSVIFPA